jgi:death-on-curing protein
VSEVQFLDLDDAVAMIRRLGIGPVRDLGLLDSALHRPRTSAFGEEAYPTIVLKAAALLDSLVNNHPLVDGTKRLAWLATTVFCDLNDHELELDDDAAFLLVWDVAGTSMGVDEIARRLDLSGPS